MYITQHNSTQHPHCYTHINNSTHHLSLLSHQEKPFVPNGNRNTTSNTATTKTLTPNSSEHIHIHHQTRQTLQTHRPEHHLHHRAPSRHHHVPHHGLHSRRERKHPHRLRWPMHHLKLPDPLFRPHSPTFQLHPTNSPSRQTHKLVQIPPSRPRLLVLPRTNT